MDADHKATVGYNYEVATFSQFTHVEFVDPSGGDTMQKLWPTFLDALLFDYVVYVIDMSQHLARTSRQGPQTHFEKDRSLLLQLLSHPRLAKARNKGDASGPAKFFIYLNYKNQSQDNKSTRQLGRILATNGLHLRNAHLGGRGNVQDIPLKNYIDTPEVCKNTQNVARKRKRPYEC